MKTAAAADPAGTGAQTVERACVLLQEIARAGREGARMLDLCSATGFSRPTAHRILRSLAAAGFVRQAQGSRRYQLGAALFELGLAAPTPVECFPAVTQAIDDLAEATGDTVYLMLRSGDDVVCAWRGVGGAPSRGNLDAGRLSWFFGREVVPAEEPFDPESYDALLRIDVGKARASFPNLFRDEEE